jgi:nucleoside-diphosphate-sugar epimerase
VKIMTRRVALVVGPTGAAGAPLVRALASQGGWGIYGLSRSAPGPGAPFVHVAADLADPASCVQALRQIEPVTHAFYAARAPFSEGGVEEVAANLKFFRSMLDALEATTDRLEHVHLVTGTKWYGMHLGPFPTPAREDDPRHLPPNFYYDQQDLLAARSAAARWTWSASRPSFICDAAPERSRNLAPVLGAYAAICRELGVGLDFPGTRAGFDSLHEVTEAGCLADAIVHLASHADRCTGPYNVTNGDTFRWNRLWPRLARWFGIPCGEPRDLRLARWMADKQPVWDRIVERHRLQPRPLQRVAAWDFGDFVLRQDWDILSDIGRLRRAGFGGSVDTLEMFQQQIGAYREARILPP